MVQNFTKKTAVITSSVMLVSLLAGCGASSSSTHTDGSSGKGTTLTLMIDNGSETTLGPALKAVADAAQKKYNINIKIDIKPGGADGDNLVKTRIATGDLDDLLFYNTGSLFQALNPPQNFVDLTNEPYMANVMDSFKQTVTSNGKLYGVPVGPTAVGAILYNKKVYQQLGLSVPKTWAEFMANNEKIKAAGKVPVIGSFKDTWTSQLLILGDYYNVQAQVPTFAQDYTNNKAKYATTPAALRGFEKLNDVFKQGDMNKDFQATTYDAGLKMLADGTGVQYPMLSSALAQIAQTYPDKINDIGVFPEPSDDASINGYTVWMPSGLYINKNGKNVDAAKKWVEFFMSPEGQSLFTSKVPAVGPYVVKGDKLPNNAYPAVKDMTTYFDAGKTAPALEYVSPVKGPNLEKITVEDGSGLKTPLQAAQEYDQDVLKQAKQLNLPGW